MGSDQDKPVQGLICVCVVKRWGRRGVEARFKVKVCCDWTDLWQLNNKKIAIKTLGRSVDVRSHWFFFKFSETHCHQHFKTGLELFNLSLPRHLVDNYCTFITKTISDFLWQVKLQKWADIRIRPVSTDGYFCNNWLLIDLLTDWFLYMFVAVFVSFLSLLQRPLPPASSSMTTRGSRTCWKTTAGSKEMWRKRKTLSKGLKQRNYL